jgi:hypothetical protein
MPLIGVIKWLNFTVSIRKTQNEITLFLRGRFLKFPALHTKAAPNGKCCEGYIAPSMVRLIYQFQAATCSSMLEALALVVVLLLSPYKVGQAGNFWTLLRRMRENPFISWTNHKFYYFFWYRYLLL